MLELARERSAGAHPYLVPPEYAHLTREILGDAALLAPEQSVLLEADSHRAFERSRAFVADYLTMPNDVDNLRRLGFETWVSLRFRQRAVAPRPGAAIRGPSDAL